MNRKRPSIGLLPFCALLLFSETAAAALYDCTTKHSYSLEGGAYVPSEREESEVGTWPKVIFDSDSGILRYGGSLDLDGSTSWVTKSLTVTANNPDLSNVSGYFMHNGTIFNAFEISAWTKPPQFQWLGGGLSGVLTGTCEIVDP